MQKKSFFKVIFWILGILIGLLLLSVLGLALTGKKLDPDFPVFMAVYLIIFVVIIAALMTVLAVYIYKDASKRGMDPWLWMTIVVFLPNFIGLIIYLIVRKNGNNREMLCPNCGKSINGEFKICPYCGAELSYHCPHCGREVSKEWNTCPYCSKNLKEEIQ